MSIKLVCWNIAKRREPWRELVAMDGVDVAVLQEAGRPPPELVEREWIGPRKHYDSHVWNSDWFEGRWNRLLDRWPMVVQLSDRVNVEWFNQVSPISRVAQDEIAVSGIGHVAAARVIPQQSEIESFIVVSMYARWIEPHPTTETNWIGYSDGSAHRIISDLSAFIGNTNPATHRIIAAGDLNMIFESDPGDPQSLSARERTVFDRMGALGLELIGPQHPAGRRASPTPHGLEDGTLNVPTFHSTQQAPETAQSQLDYAFASRGFHQRVKARALNSPEECGASDHCRIVIDVG
ncbi:MAG: endonuclease/exonuclease/phosphatase family protein [Chloroflexi bacterium]|nr:endonuclease/exonuclease/phosphatase family protein [Chloroflexota bacterium]MYC00829.1 endonuclease/exonuclease/phosphatase family protein [Chloroflexota bacterium]